MKYDLINIDSRFHTKLYIKNALAKHLKKCDTDFKKNLDKNGIPYRLS